MKNELIDLCEELEGNFDERLELYEDRINRIDSEIGERLQNLSIIHPDNDDVAELEQLLIGLKRTHRLMLGKLSAIRDNSAELINELGIEISERIPNMKKNIENSATYEQAEVEIRREAHSGSDSFKDLLKALFMWRETPEEHLAGDQQ